MNEDLVRAMEETKRYIFELIGDPFEDEDYLTGECPVVEAYEFEDSFQEELDFLVYYITNKNEQEAIMSDSKDGFRREFYCQYVVAISEIICWLEFYKKEKKETHICGIEINYSLERYKTLLKGFQECELGKKSVIII